MSGNGDGDEIPVVPVGGVSEPSCGDFDGGRVDTLSCLVSSCGELHLGSASNTLTRLPQS